MAKWYDIKAAAEGDGSNGAVIHLYDEIGYWGTTAKDFAEDLKALGPVKAITVRINSGGGEVFAGIAIHNLLKSHAATVTVMIDGIAASIASVIAMAGDKIVMPSNAMMMIHNPSWWASGTAEDMREAAQVLDQIKKSLVAAYRGKTKLDDARIEELMTAETWMTAAEAKTLGFADEVSEPVEAAAFAKVDPSRYAKVPQAISDRLRAPATTGTTTNNAPAAPPGNTARPDDQKPAAPEALAEACAKAGFADLTAPLLKAKATMAVVTARLNEAKAIVDAGQRVRQPALARRLIAEGVSEASARVILVDAAAARDEAIVTDTTRPGTQANPGPVLDHKAIYARMNGLKQG